MTTIRARIDTELTRRVGTWFTVREIQKKLRVNPATLKPLIMKYAREKVLKRRRVTGTSRSVEFTPNANNQKAFQKLVVCKTPYRDITSVRSASKKTGVKKSPSRRSKTTSWSTQTSRSSRAKRGSSRKRG
ncbi:MAG: hypothetical protein GYA55_07340 [SAR324 cluster bacterium]|uniref:Uncharacterized protein n=1 Tax=SAR324 cluster bacterium TaxID=2024889 RepID=A0A7X9IJC6_9DELT|nr:hypothetical protein [SAR324 cluster bacterium]